MRITETTLGTITVDGVVYDHDVILRRSGEVIKRKKMLSKRIHGTSHIISEDEADFLFEDGCTKVIIGTGQSGRVELSPEAELFFRRRGCAVFSAPTPLAIEAYNTEAGEKIALFHVTC